MESINDRRLGRLYAWQFGDEWRYAGYRRGAPANATVVEGMVENDEVVLYDNNGPTQRCIRGAKLHQFNER
jgi:hypothetical protein